MASLRQTLLDYLVSTLLPGITTGGGYNFTLASIQRGQRALDEMGDTDFPCVFIGATDENREQISSIHWKAELEVDFVGGVKNSGSLTNGQVQGELDKLIEDLSKAVMTDILQGGRVKATEIRRIRTDHGDIEPHAAFVMQVVFMYVGTNTAP